jgi:hypothetical protein
MAMPTILDNVADSSAVERSTGNLLVGSVVRGLSQKIDRPVDVVGDHRNRTLNHVRRDLSIQICICLSAADPPQLSLPARAGVTPGPSLLSQVDHL